MYFLMSIWLIYFYTCFLCAASFVNLGVKNWLSSMSKWDQTRYEDSIDWIYKHWKNCLSFVNSNYEENSWNIWFVNSLLFLEWYNYELRENIKNVQLNKESLDINETNYMLKQFLSEQIFHRKDKYDLISDFAELESHLGKHEFSSCFNLNLRFWATKYWIIYGYWIEDIDNLKKMGIILSQWNSLNYILKWISWNFNLLSKDFINYPVKFILWKEIFVKNYMKRFEDYRTCYNIFSSQKNTYSTKFEKIFKILSIKRILHTFLIRFAFAFMHIYLVDDA